MSGVSFAVLTQLSSITGVVPVIWSYSRLDARIVNALHYFCGYDNQNLTYGHPTSQ